ncbi:hypothetical protein GCM10025862_05640 [Arsenicicoccus piscis]|uniref:Uncharacterized protein n=1 Tax=Arsenicicoccus piscis TaxID=673954 RepID=A0ABQ6HKF2_9MICO|nr:hypothetical protein GCM10025862_05640 [Arsenicicoccus piscis]
MRDVRDELLLQRREGLQLADLGLQAGRHPVERPAERGQVVGAADGHPLVQLARGQPLGDLRRAPHRLDDLAGDDERDAREQQDEEDRRGR